MIVYRISKCKYIKDLSGKGAALAGGRWNSEGVYMIYAAATPSLAMLETIVHIANIPFEDYCMIILEMPENNIQEIDAEDLPQNWSEYPAPDILKSIGDGFIKESSFLALKIPSAVMAQDSVYLINPGHPDFRNIQIISTTKIPIDKRLLK